jgi:2',3'-cyclic-nucleotide 2'-phosphodiesterase
VTRATQASGKIRSVKVLFLGDIVGERATEHAAERVPKLRAEYGIDIAIANAENCAPNGLGMATKQVEQLLAAGVDVITGGNHSWDSDESVDLLALEQVIRPSNLSEPVAGRGVIHVDVPAGTVTVINLADYCAMKSVKAVAGRFVPAYESWLRAEKRGVVIVDYHGDHVLEKQIFAHAVDGAAAAVIGTHTHEPTAPLHILPGGTAFVTEVGMVGPVGGVQGFDPGPLVAGLQTTGNPFSGSMPGTLDGPVNMGAVMFQLDGGRTVRLERVS